MPVIAAEILDRNLPKHRIATDDRLAHPAEPAREKDAESYRTNGQSKHNLKRLVPHATVGKPFIHARKKGSDVLDHVGPQDKAPLARTTLIFGRQTGRPAPYLHP
jgi:hypothetical protein